MFLEPLACSAFSFLRGGSPPEELVRRAAELGYSALGLPDHLGFYGTARAHAAAEKLGLRALVGATLRDGTSLLCPTKGSYQILSCHLSDLHLNGKDPLQEDSSQPVLPSFSSARNSSLLAFTGHPGTPLYRAILQAKTQEATHHLEGLLTTFGPGNCYLVLTRHLTRYDALLTRSLRELSERYRIPLIISNTPLYARKRDKLIADVFSCLRHHTTLDQAGTLLGRNAERYLKSPTDLASLFPDQREALAETLRLNERIDFTLSNLGYRFPSLLPEHRNDPDAAHEMLSHLSAQGLRNRYRNPSSQAHAQLNTELALIRKLEFSGYFLIVHDIITFANSQGILCQGRGSAANSVVCYALGLTAVDPIGGGLLFERFLSENRKSWPDIDIDFPSGERRESVIQYVFQKYGQRGAAMTANVITYRPRSTFRELSKVLGFPEEIANRFSNIHASPRSEDPAHDIPKTTPSQPSSATSQSTSQSTPISQMLVESGVPATHPRHKPLAYLFEHLLSLPRHLGQHSGGIIICDDGLDKIVPIQPAAMPGRTIVQWDKDDCEDLGIVKIDLLGLGMLAAMEDTIRICRQRGKVIDLAQIPKDDEATFHLMCAADTIGTFQVESRAQMNTLPILRPRIFYDVAIEVAIIRPGPIVGELAHPYLNRRQGLEKIDYIHPLFQPVLERTLGVPLFQEQVLRMAMLIADFTGTEADELRRAMAFKRSDEKMEAVTRKLRRNMTAKGICDEVQNKVVHAIGSFALYGFPESHAISFGLIAYASCWLKVHHPVEFYAGLINNQPMGFYNVSTLLQDARRHGVRVRPISVVRSELKTSVVGQEREDKKTTQNPTALPHEEPLSLRLGLHRLKGLSETTAQRIIAERDARSYCNLVDFLRRARPNKKERRLLAESGALNDLSDIQHRRHALWMVERPLQLDLFSYESFSSSSPSSAPLKVMSPWERLSSDFATQGQSTGAHPMRLWREAQNSAHSSQNLKTAAELAALEHGRYLQIAGLVICRQRPQTAKGHCFISLEDETGIANIFVPRKTFEAHRLTITTESFLLIEGSLQIGEGQVASVYTHHLTALCDVPGAVDCQSHDFK